MFDEGNNRRETRASSLGDFSGIERLHLAGSAGVLLLGRRDLGRIGVRVSVLLNALLQSSLEVVGLLVKSLVYVGGLVGILLTNRQPLLSWVQE